MFNLLKRKKPAPQIIEVPVKKREEILKLKPVSRDEMIRLIQERFEVNLNKYIRKTGAMDSNYIKSVFNLSNSSIPDAILRWYSSQGFIGFQTCAFLYQKWLIAKACNIPGLDALRKGYEITVNNDTKVDVNILDEMRGLDKFYRVNHNLEKMESRCRLFGIRVVKFDIKDADDEFYENPFNPDGIKPGSYLGMTQIDPSWITPELDMRSAGDPGYQYYLEPTWWVINGRRYHRSHLIVIRHEEVPDIIKPAYLFGGLSIPQKIYERVYNAERTANEAPMLLMTKRLMVKKVDMSAALANQQAFEARSVFSSYCRDNYGYQMVDVSEDVTQLDTNLGDLDAIIKGQYDLVAAAADMPVSKFMGTSPGGFNSSGDYEEASYHELLGIIKEAHFTPLLERHYQLLMLSEICPKYGIAPFNIKIEWQNSDELTEKEAAEVNKLKSDTDAVNVGIGALTGEDVRNRLMNDPKSGYNGIGELPESDELDLDDEDETAVY